MKLLVPLSTVLGFAAIAPLNLAPPAVLISLAVVAVIATVRMLSF